MPTVEFEGNTFNIDEDGFIDDFNNWNETWVNYVKQTEGIEELTEELLNQVVHVVDVDHGLLLEERRLLDRVPLQADEALPLLVLLLEQVHPGPHLTSHAVSRREARI